MTGTAAGLLVKPLGRIFDALDRGDVDAVLVVVEEICHPEVELTSGIGSAVEGRTYTGFDGLREWFGDLVGAFELSYNDREFREMNEDAVLFLSRLELRGRGSGASVIQELGTLFESKNGLVFRAVTYRSHRDAIAAAEALDA